MMRITTWPTWHDRGCTRQRENETIVLDLVIENLCEAEEKQHRLFEPVLYFRASFDAARGEQ